MRQRKGAKAGGAPPAPGPAPAPPTPQRLGHGELPPTPALRFGLAVLLGVRLLGAATLMITDCDETFNYWEPAHYTLYGWGFQTWEYSPAYALRSYLFLLPHSVAVKALHAATGSKVTAFYGARALQGLLAARHAAGMAHDQRHHPPRRLHVSPLLPHPLRQPLHGRGAGGSADQGLGGGGRGGGAHSVRDAHDE